MLAVTVIALAVLGVVLAMRLARLQHGHREIRQSEERLRHATRVAGVGVYEHDHVTGNLYWSPEMRRICDWSDDLPPSVAGFLERVHPDDRPTVARAIERSHDPRFDGTFDLEHRILRPDGSTRWLNLRAVTLFEGTGPARRAVRSIGTAIDATSRRRTEEESRQIAERLRQTVRATQIGIFDHDQVRDVIWWSPEQRRNYGFTAEEPVTLEKFVQAVHPDDRDRIFRAVQRAHDPTGDGLYDVEHRIVRRDGAIRWLVTRSQTLFEGDGQQRHPVRTIGAVLDITDHRQAEEQLRRREQVYGAIVNQAMAGIILVDQKTHGIAEFNEVACSMLGYPREEFAKLLVEDLAPDQDAVGRVRAALDNLVEDGGDLGIRTLRRRDGALVPVLMGSRRIALGTEGYLALVWQDLTERNLGERLNLQLASLVRHSHEFIGIAELDGRVTFINEFGRQLYGLESDEPIAGRMIADFVSPAHHERLQREVMPGLLKAGRWIGNLDFVRRRGGPPVPMLTEGFRIDDLDGRPLCFASVSRDITDIRRAEEELRHLNRLYLTLSHANQAISRANSRQLLLDRICRIAVEDVGFRLAWIGRVTEEGEVVPDAMAGAAASYLVGVHLTLDQGLPEGRGPTAEALRSGERIVVNDFIGADQTAPWHERARQHGIRSSAAFPISRNGRVTEVLCVYHGEPGMFGAREISLLDDLAADVSFGLENIEKEAALDLSRRQLQDIEAAVPVGTLRLTLPQGAVWWSGSTGALLGLAPGAAMTYAELERAVGPEVSFVLRAAAEEAVRSGDPIDLDIPLRAGREDAKTLRFLGRPRRLADGRTEISCALHDVSERKRLEADLARAGESERRHLASELHDNLGQILYAISLFVDSLAKQARKDASPLLDRVEEIDDAIHKALDACRQIAHEVAPVMDGGLSAALRELAQQARLAGVECRANVAAAADDTITGPRAVELYRIAQEAVTNALKYAHCRRIDIGVEMRRAGIELTVSDDGVGADPSAIAAGKGLGLRTMRYRAGRVGGVLEFHSSPIGGTLVRVRAPLAVESPMQAQPGKRSPA